ncbi:hypothetical protein DM01DRAFT_278325 [Hesseltinella vesiculosa]|uniref:Uncharacterized protein n=1 Tax=Hesseltinella vesiculosa TaxID=101127 RepID=A0A1X2GCS9_9FUNG|nr:hypothetical protein DM01DRAFT_278325 [Hesseltinella vesiculosa]
MSTIYLGRNNEPSYGDFSVYDDKKQPERTSRTISEQPFNQRLTIFLPNCSTEEAQNLLKYDHEPIYYRVTMPCSAMLQPDFFKKYVSSEMRELLLHTEHENLTSDCVIMLDQRRHLVLSLTKEVYETFGMVGHAYKQNKKHRWVVDVDLSSRKMRPGNELFNRLLTCLENTFKDPLDWVAVLTDTQTGELESIDWPSGVKAVPIKFDMQMDTLEDVDLPALDYLHEDLDKANWFEKAMEAEEWLGRLVLAPHRLRHTSSNAFVSTSKPPATCMSHASGTLVTWKGLIPSCFVNQILILTRKWLLNNLVTFNVPWAFIGAWGMRDSPKVRTEAHHFYGWHGENDYHLVCFPPDETRQWLVYEVKMIGTNIPE